MSAGIPPSGRGGGGPGLPGAERGLRRALATGGIVVHYQPQQDLATGAVVGAEALLRWYEGGLVRTAADAGLVLGLAAGSGAGSGAGSTAGAGTAMAVDRGLGVEVGRAVVRAAADAARVMHLQGCADVPIWVNLSPAQLADPTLPATVTRTVDDAAIAPERLGFEVPAAVLDVRRSDTTAVEVLRALHGRGHGLALDRVGAGPSPMSLHPVPVAVVKLDGALVRAAASGGRVAAAVADAVRLAHRLGVRVVAAGVELPDQLAVLRALGCDLAQGYATGRPAPLEFLCDRMPA